MSENQELEVPWLEIAWGDIAFMTPGQRLHIVEILNRQRTYLRSMKPIDASFRPTKLDGIWVFEERGGLLGESAAVEVYLALRPIVTEPYVIACRKAKTLCAAPLAFQILLSDRVRRLRSVMQKNLAV